VSPWSSVTKKLPLSSISASGPLSACTYLGRRHSPGARHVGDKIVIARHERVGVPGTAVCPPLRC
jgi:hypothetical protein